MLRSSLLGGADSSSLAVKSSSSFWILYGLFVALGENAWQRLQLVTCNIKFHWWMLNMYPKWCSTLFSNAIPDWVKDSSSLAVHHQVWAASEKMGKVKARGAGILGPPGLPGGDWLKARLTIEQNPALVMCPHLFCLTSFYAVSSPYDDRIQCPLDIRMSLYTLCCQHCWIWYGHVTICNQNLHW